MSKPEPLLFKWTGEVMEPFAPSKAAQQYKVGERYRLAVHEDRSPESHRHYFACINEVFKQLPEEIAAKVPTPEYLRKWALIRCGYRNELVIPCNSEDAAIKAVATVKVLDEYAIAHPDGTVLTIYTAESQNMKAMGRQRFNESKQAVLDLLAGLIGVSVDELGKNAGQAA